MISCWQILSWYNEKFALLYAEIGSTWKDDFYWIFWNCGRYYSFKDWNNQSSSWNFSQNYFRSFFDVRGIYYSVWNLSRNVGQMCWSTRLTFSGTLHQLLKLYFQQQVLTILVLWRLFHRVNLLNYSTKQADLKVMQSFTSYQFKSPCKRVLFLTLYASPHWVSLALCF